MKILVGCEYSGRVRDRFNRRGHQAVSVDLIPSESPGPHIIANVLDIVSDKWDMLIAFPPCTAVCASGNRWYANTEEREAALDFIYRLMCAPIHRIAIENPIGVISTEIRKPDQTIQPYMFGHAWYKTTHLWLKNLPPLQATNIVEPVQYNRILHSRAKSKIRSRTPGGIATAMAKQWGSLLCLLHYGE